MPTGQPSSYNSYPFSSGQYSTQPTSTPATALGPNPPGPSPSGYTWDPVQNKYVTTVGSAGNRQALQTQALGEQNALFGQEQTAFNKAMQTPYGGGLPAAPTLPSLQGVPAAAGNTPQVQQIQMPDMSAAQNAAFNTAKNQQGKVTASALAGLQSSLAGRGLLGGGYEGKGTTDIVQQGAQALGDLTNQQAITQAQQALQTGLAGYQGAIQQRGQSIQQGEAQQQAALQQQSQLANQALNLYDTQARNQLAQQQMALQQGNYQTQALNGLMNSLTPQIYY